MNNASKYAQKLLLSELNALHRGQSEAEAETRKLIVEEIVEAIVAAAQIETLKTSQRLHREALAR